MKSDVDRIVTIMKDKKYLEDLGVTPKDIIKAIRMAQDEFKELEQIVNNLNNNNECFKSVCEKLKGHNEYFDAIYPDHNYFDLNYKSLLVTVIQPINENNVKTSMKVSKKDVCNFIVLPKKYSVLFLILSINSSSNLTEYFFISYKVLLLTLNIGIFLISVISSSLFQS